MNIKNAKTTYNSESAVKRVAIPCPFCKGRVQQGERKHYNKPRECIWCTKCLAIIRRHTQKEAVDAWNQRAL
jgi:hypothetical protein